MIAVGDTVRIVRSPYSSVNPGTVARVLVVKKEHFKFERKPGGKPLFTLDTSPCSLFREHEITKTEVNHE